MEISSGKFPEPHLVDPTVTSFLGEFAGLRLALVEQSVLIFAKRLLLRTGNASKPIIDP